MSVVHVTGYYRNGKWVRGYVRHEADVKTILNNLAVGEHAEFEHGTKVKRAPKDAVGGRFRVHGRRATAASNDPSVVLSEVGRMEKRAKTQARRRAARAGGRQKLEETRVKQHQLTHKPPPDMTVIERTSSGRGFDTSRPTLPKKDDVVLKKSPTGRFELRQHSDGKYSVWDTVENEMMSGLNSTGAKGGKMSNQVRAEERFMDWSSQELLPGGMGPSKSVMNPAGPTAPTGLQVQLDAAWARWRKADEDLSNAGSQQQRNQALRRLHRASDRIDEIEKKMGKKR